MRKVSHLPAWIRLLFLFVGVGLGGGLWLGASCVPHGGQRLFAHPTGDGPNAPEADVAVAGKLPKGVEPRLYDVHLSLDPNDDHFQGTADIAVALLEPDTRVVLHADNLRIAAVEVRAGDGQERTVSFVAAKDTGTLALNIEPALPSGMSTLHIAYTAAFGEDLAGIYKHTADGNTYIFSQFEPIAARRAFPCFDEPRFKAPLRLRVTAPKELLVAANAPVEAEQVEDSGRKTWSFQPTPPLPTYLWAVAVGPFDVVTDALPISPQRAYAVPLRGLASRGQGDKMKASVRQMGGIVQALEGYVDLPYPFAKMDVVAVPDFAWSAMENAGLMTFRDWLLLTDGADAPYAQRRASQSVIAHELVHQWFGNWVTMPWWDDLWLNEAFATWLGAKTAQHGHPGMQFELEQVAAAGDAMDQDGLPSVRRVREPCRNKDDIFNAADGITYQKSASILRMFEHFLGPQRFMQGLRVYLKRFAFHSAGSDTFLQTLGEAAQEPMLAEAMRSFLDQPGVPEISFSWTCGGDGPQLQLAQERWRPLGVELGSATWKVPVCVRYGGARGEPHRVCTLLGEESRTLALRACPSWFVPNADGAGYYRSRVSDARAVESALMHGRATAAEVLAELDNTQGELRSGAIAGEQALTRFAAQLAHENPRVVRRALGHLDDARRRFLPASAVGTGPAGPVPGAAPPAAAAEAAAHDAARLGALLRPPAQRLGREYARLSAERLQKPSHGREAEALADGLGELGGALADVTAKLALAARDGQTQGALTHMGVEWLDAQEVLLLPPALRAPTGAAVTTARTGRRQRAPSARSGTDALGSDAVALALTVATETLGAPFLARLEQLLVHVDGGEVRQQVLRALAQVATAREAAHVRELALSGPLHVGERLRVLAYQLAPGPAQAAAWQWTYENLGPLLARLSERDQLGLVGLGGWLCQPGQQEAFMAHFGPVAAQVAGGPRALRQAQESMVRCAAEVAVQQDSVRTGRVFGG